MRAAANASNAAAGNSAAHAELVRTQTAGVKQDLEANRKLNSIYDQMDQVNADPKLTPEQRAEKLSTLERRAQSMQGVGRAKSGEKPDSVETKEEVEYGEDGKPLSRKVTTTKKGADRGQSKGPDAPAGPWDRFKSGGQDVKPKEQPKQPGQSATMLQGLRSALTEGASAGNAIEALRAKVRAGQPLSDEERATARRMGMGV